ncbi:MAG: hypothetical protein IT514_16310, partial [Burkholderiales bacterium]|nr:hypothetical protein [Burkholderiales bacterium]
MIEPPSDQPQSIGDLIGRAFRVYRRHLPFFFKILLPPTIASTAGALGLQWAVTAAMSGDAAKPATIALMVGIIISSLIALLLSKWVLAIRQLAFVRMTTGFADTYPEAHAFTHSKRWVIVALYVLSIVTMSVVVGAWAIAMTATYSIINASPGLRVAGLFLSTVGLIFALTLAVLTTLLVFSVTACENQSLGGYISRASELTMAGLWRSIGFGALMAVTLTAISYPLSLPVVLLSLFDIFQQGVAASESMLDTYRMPFYVMVISQCWESIINMLLWPVIFIAYGYFYYDLRLRQEGLDLARRLDSL